MPASAGKSFIQMQQNFVLRLLSAAARVALPQSSAAVGKLVECKPSIFLHQVQPLFPRIIRDPGSRPSGYRTPIILELGCGDGVDARRLHTNGNHVQAVDLRTDGFWGGPEFIKADMRTVLREAPDEMYDVVYSHLGAHYFNDVETQQLFRDAFRVLRLGGYLCLLLNSTSDPEFKKSPRIVKGDISDPEVFWEMGYRNVEGKPKRFFDLTDVARYIDHLHFEIVRLDTNGKFVNAEGREEKNLVRVVLRKPLIREG